MHRKQHVDRVRCHTQFVDALIASTHDATRRVVRSFVRVVVELLHACSITDLHAKRNFLRQIRVAHFA